MSRRSPCALASTRVASNDDARSVSHIVPWNGRVEGSATRWYATSLDRDAFATGVLVAQHEGGVVALRGHPEHPASLGGTGPAEWAALRDLYDRARVRRIEHGGRPRPWADLVRHLGDRDDRGAGLRIVLAPTASPLRLALLEHIAARLPAARWSFAATTTDPIGEATAVATGRRASIVHRIDRVERLVTLDADLFAEGPAALAYARVAAHRRAASSLRAFAAEPRRTVTGAGAERRLVYRASDIPALLLALFDAVIEPSSDSPSHRTALSPEARAWVDEVARELAAHRGRGLVVVGERQPVAAHVVALAIDEALGNLGSTAHFVPALVPAGLPGQQSALLTSAEIEAGEVHTLVVLETDPLRTRTYPRSDRRVRRPAVVWLGARRDSTAVFADWIVPALHELEAWGVGRAFDGTITMRQPIVSPSRSRPGKTCEELLAVLGGRAAASGRALLGALWPILAPDVRIEDALRCGFLPGSAARPEAVTVPADVLHEAVAELEASRSPTLELALHLRSDVTSAPAELGVATAADLGVVDGGAIDLVVDGESLRTQVRVAADHAESSISLPLASGGVVHGSVDAWPLVGEVLQRIRPVAIATLAHSAANERPSSRRSRLGSKRSPCSSRKRHR